MPFYAPTPTQAAAAVPLSDSTPVAEARAAAAGVMDKASRGDHTHPRLTSATIHTLNASSEATVVFTRSFASKPSWIPAYEEQADGMPVSLKVKTWTQDGNGNYIGCVIKGYRGQSTGLTVSLLNLANLNLFQGSAAGVVVSFTALQTSTV